MATREPSVNALVKQLHSKDALSRLRAASTLGQMAEAAAGATDALAEALNDGDPLVRKAAALALGDIGAAAASAVPSLVLALHDGVEPVRRRVAVALAEIGPEGLDALRIAAGDGSAVARAVLAEIGPLKRRAA